MKKTALSLLALILAAIMLMSVFASCTTGNQENDSEKESSDTQEPGGDESESESGNNGDIDTPVIPPDLSKLDSGLLIGHANSLMNGVNAYFTDGKRTDFVLENQNMSMGYALAAAKDQLITYLNDKEGNNYITGTSDVFVKMTNGNVFYASNSTKPATANLYRFGYYMYEARFEEQNFMSTPITEGAHTLSTSSISKNHAKVTVNDDGALNVTLANIADPFISLKNVNFSADEYPYLQITMRSNAKSVRSLTVYLSTEAQSMRSAQSFLVSPTEEYVTYLVPLYRTSWYTGNVTGLRLDFEGGIQVNDNYEIKEFKLLKGQVEGTPDALGLNRSFFVYSDKLHHMIQIATDKVATENIAAVGLETKIAKNTVAKLIAKDKNGTHTSLADVDWDSAEYVGFDITDAGIFGYILPAGEKTDKLEVIDDGENYVIIQSRTPENGTIMPSGTYNESTKKYEALVDDNANDFYMGQRIYTDDNHDFEKFLLEAHIERNPLGNQNIVVNKRDSSYDADYECPLCGKMYEDYVNVCTACDENIKPIEHENMYFMGYNALRGLYVVRVPGESFNAPYFQYPNKYINSTFLITGDEYDRDIYFMTHSTVGCLECAVVLNEEQMLLPVPVEVGKNFSEGSGERNLWNIQDNTYSEAIVPMKILANSRQIYTMLNLYQNWGQYPLKQVSWIQFYAPYYHLSTGVTESNCIVPYYSCKNARGLGTLPDHRAMSAHLWAGQPQHTSGGSHVWLQYTDINGVYSASENTLDYIDSHGPVYADVYMDYLSDDGNIKISYTHMEFPQTDENRAFYEMKYEVLGDVSFEDFSRDFSFYTVGDNDAKGSYVNVGYLNESNECVIVDAAKGTESNKYVLGDYFPYFSFFNMPDYDRESTSAEGFVNLSFLIKNYEFTVNGQKSDAHFVIINEDNRVRLSLDLGNVTLKKGDTFTINAIVMPWGDERLDYSVVGDKNVRDVRENTLINPLTPTAVENCEVIESVFLPKFKSTNGKDATFTLKGGQNNVAVRVYGFTMLTVPKIQELVDGEWVDYRISSAYKPDRFGNAHYYDGYSVHYDADGTFSYSFIVPMDYTDADGRTFRFAASEEFTEWPKRLPVIEDNKEELPLNVFVDALGVMSEAQNQAGKSFGSITLSDDGTYVTLSSTSKAREAYFTVWQGDGGRTSTGQYLVLKYRQPTTNNNKHGYFEIFTSTAGSDKVCFPISNAFINDGEWHTLVIDLSTWESNAFNPDESGEYKTMSVRFDFFNEYYPDGNSIDIEFFGMSDSLEEIRAYEKVDAINVFAKGKGLVTYDKNGNEIETPSDSAGGNQGGITDATSPVPGFNVYIDANQLTKAGKSTLWQDCVSTSADGSYSTFKNHINGSTDSQKQEIYISVYSSNGLKATGQYAVIKYRSNVQQGSITLWTSTENDSPSGKNYVDLNAPGGSNGLFIADNEWHIVVVDLSKLISTYTATEGKFVAKHLRVDFFNFSSPRDPSDTRAQVDVAYIGLCDDYTEILKYDNSVSELTLFNGKTYKFSTSTGAMTYAPDGETTPPSSQPEEPKYTFYYNATKIIEASQKGGGHIGKSELLESGNVARLYNCVDASRPNNVRMESYFTLLSSNKSATGQYLVIKYRATQQVGSIQIYTSTENASAAESGTKHLYGEGGTGNGLFIADGEWKIVIIDLSKAIKTFSAAENGDYYATHLRLDLFNFSKPQEGGETAYVDLAYVGLCKDYTAILGEDTSVDNVIFYDGTTQSIENKAQ